MKKRRILWVLAPVLVSMLISCSSGGRAGGADGPSGMIGGGSGGGGDSVTPAGWWRGPFECTLELTDGTGTEPLVLNVVRDGDMEAATLSSPASLAGMSVTVLPEGNHIIYPGYDISVSDDGAAGLRLLFDALTHDLSSLTFDESGAASFSLDGAEVTMTLDGDGMPSSFSVKHGGYRRDAEVVSFTAGG